MKYDTVLFLRTPGQELLHSIIRFLYLKEAIFTKELRLLIFIIFTLYGMFFYRISSVFYLGNLKNRT